SDNVKFDGFKVSGDNPLIDGYSYAGMNIEKGQGVYTEGNNVLFQNNIIEKATSMGFYAGGTQSTQYQNLVVTNNKIDKIHDVGAVGYGFGLYIQGTAGSITNNVVTNVRNGIQVQPYRVIKGAGTPVLQVKGNEFATYKAGIYYNYSEEGASAWTIEQNDITVSTPPVTPAAPLTWVGLKVETIYSTADGGILKTNTIDGTGASIGSTWSSIYGMQYAGSNSNSFQVFFTDNTVSNVQVGFKHDASANIVFTGNSLSASQKAIEITGAFNIDATGGNTFNGIASGSATLSQLFGIEDAINHKIDESSRGLVTVKASELYVTPLSYAGVNTTPKIQRGIDAAGSSGWTVNVGPGTFNENVLLNKSVTLIGQGAVNTILTPATPCTYSPATGGIGISVSAADAKVKDMRVASYYTGVSVASLNNEINNVEIVSNCNQGLELGGGTGNLSVLNSKINGNFMGFRKGTAPAISGFTMDNCEVKGNSAQGCFIATTTGGTFNNVSIKNSDFSNNLQKGMYFEALSNALLDGIIMNNSGSDASYGFNTGIDINLKYGNYSNITLKNSEITNCGATGTAIALDNPIAIAIKARDDGSYAGNPATLNNVNVLNNIISGPNNGIRFGEFGKINAGPTNVTVYQNDISAVFSNKAVINNTNSNITAECNWWGSSASGTIASKIAGIGTGVVDFDPWILTAGDDAGFLGFQPTGTCSRTLILNTLATPYYIICSETT
ncbi:MAG: right-handed parallel beta-helix repeat-containing protein, partial [Bacteroidota bacterium]